MAYVQSANIRNAAGSAVKAFTSNVGAGSLIVVGIMFEDVTTSTSSVTDNLGNSYTEAGTIIRTTTSLGIQVYYAWNVAAGATTVTATASAATPISIAIHEYNGMMTSANPFDTTVGNFANSSDAPDSGSLTTAVSNELLFAFMSNNRSTPAAGTGYTLREAFAFNRNSISEDQTAGAAGSYNATTGLLSLAGQWAIRLVAFKPPAVGGAPRRTLLGAGL